MPDLASLPAGNHIFVDTNIFTLHYRGKSLSCSAFLARVAQGEVFAYVNLQVLSDLLHKLMLAEAVSKGMIAKMSAAQLKNRFQTNRALAGQLVDYQTQFENSLRIGFSILPLNRRLLVATKAERITYGLLTGDSLHLGCMSRRRPALADIATQDGDFLHIGGVTMWQPMDVIP
jgi:predicted nucleic acid-binding protein